MLPLAGQTLGLIGFGRISRKLVPKARGFELRVMAYDPYVPASAFQEFGVEKATLDYLLENSDFVSIHASFTPESRHMLGIKQFQRMKPNAYLINCARGEFVDEPALYTALQRGDIAGAALDILQAGHIDPDYPLLQMENVIITPHTAWYSDESVNKMRRRPYEEIARVAQGEWPRWLINTKVKENFQRRWGTRPG